MTNQPPIPPRHARFYGDLEVLAADGPDADALPDSGPMDAVIIFKMVYGDTKTLKAYSATGKPVLRLESELVYTVNQDGSLPEINVPSRESVDDKWGYMVQIVATVGNRTINTQPFFTFADEGVAYDIRDVTPVDVIDGVQSIKGEKGDPGKDGLNAYELWLQEGFTGSITDYLNSLKGADSTEPGPPGPPGEDGKDSTVPGPAPAIEVGNVYSLPNGSQPVVEVRGAGPYVLDIGLPLPKDGADSTVPGPVGPAGLNFRGVWDAVTDYVNNDLVNYEGNQWFAYGDPNIGEVPDAYSYHWNLFLAHGADGKPGKDGADSVVPGPAGPAPTMQMSTITRLPYGSTPTATISGTNPYTISLGIPDGATGAPGAANTLTVGSVIGTPAGGAPRVTITGAAPNQTINFEIPTGIQGPPGPSNNLYIGTVTTLAAGAQATASISGTSPNQSLNLGLPQGAAGTGASVQDSGWWKTNQAWDGSRSYKAIVRRIGNEVFWQVQISISATLNSTVMMSTVSNNPPFIRPVPNQNIEAYSMGTHTNPAVTDPSIKYKMTAVSPRTASGDWSLYVLNRIPDATTGSGYRYNGEWVAFSYLTDDPFPADKNIMGPLSVIFTAGNNP